ncbi:MAG: hypothetical protein JNJ85_16055 [Candidatus Kapabacteria bacterium]|nr:hypothetical protein [Candidatus Kapabacteria bacterium]MBX7155928.1 hypothetical protein [Bacteroidota bacterium]
MKSYVLSFMFSMYLAVITVQAETTLRPVVPIVLKIDSPPTFGRKRNVKRMYRQYV